MQIRTSLVALALLCIASPALAKDKPHRKVPPPKAEEIMPQPDITIQFPAATFQHAIVRDNKEPVVLLLV